MSTQTETTPEAETHSQEESATPPPAGPQSNLHTHKGTFKRRPANNKAEAGAADTAEFEVLPPDSDEGSSARVLSTQMTPSGAAPVRRLTPADREDYSEQRHIVRIGVEHILTSPWKVAEALHRIKTKKLYLIGGFKTFELFCAAECKLAKSRAYELAKAAEINHQLSATAERAVLPVNERQLRPLAPLQPEQRGPAWDNAVALAGGKPVTETHVRKAVALIKKPAEEEEEVVELHSWRAPLVEKFSAGGYEPVFVQPIRWSSEATHLYS